MFDLPERTFDPFTLSLSLDEIIFYYKTLFLRDQILGIQLKENLYIFRKKLKNIRFSENKY